jgi:PIN domain nuclease of toxin-antitoxin system
MGIEVIDACALLAYIRNEPGSAEVEMLLNDPNSRCYVHAVKLCEVYYQMIRNSDRSTANRIVSELVSLGLIIREDMDAPFWQEVGELKSRGRISLADCFCLVLAIQLQVVTSDHHEFDALVPLNLCPILFIR